MHNIISDDVSLRILIRELALIYSSYINSRPSSLPELTRQYTDFSTWQRDNFAGGCLEKQRIYWRQQLADCPPGLRLATDYPRSSGRVGHCAGYAFLAPLLLSNTLRSLCDQYQVPLFVMLLAAFKAFLHRYTEQEDLVVGITVPGRSRPEFEPQIGCFAQSLPLRTDLSGDLDFHELVLLVNRTVLNALSNQDLPFEKLLNDMQTGDSYVGEPFLRILFEWREPNRIDATWPDLKSEIFECESDLIKHDLTLETREYPEGIHCKFKYDQGLYEASTIARMAGHFLRLLEQLASNPEQPISQPSILSESELHQLMQEWNEVRAEKPESAFCHELFEAQATRTPDALAVTFQSESLTYRDLAHRTNQLAHYLQALGVRPEVPVGICMGRSINFVVTILSTLKAGGACLPLDPTLPSDRLELMATAAKCPIIMTETRFLDRLETSSARLVCVDTIQELLSQYSKEPPAHGLSEENLAHVFFTSGSTGDPKAVMWNHRKQNKSGSWAQTAFKLSEHDRHLMKSSIGFTPLNTEIFWSLLTGARLIIAPPGMEQDSAALVHYIAEQQITITNFVPSMLKVVLEEPEVASLGCLRQVFCFGEALPAQLEKRFFEKLSADLHVIYGATEAPSATYRKCVRGHQHDSINIGRRIAGRQVYILDSRLNLVPIGVPGEIFIGGESLARGYLNRPDLTAERFLPNPFSDLPGARIYRTGDQARYLTDGSLEFLGRMDHQVKIRGYRVEPREIETMLEEHPAVRESLVVAREVHPGAQQLVAYIVQKKGLTSPINELRGFLRQKLPSYMLPSSYVIIDQMPLTKAGKLNRKALPAPVWDRGDLEAAYVAPRTPVEESLAQIWSELLNIERVGIQDNFFDLGGNSLLATQLISRVRKSFRVEIPLRALFEDPSVEGLAVTVLEALAAQMEPEDITHLFSS